MKSPQDIYQDLRTLALQGTREKLGLSSTQHSNDCWGVIMDWGLDRGTATIVAFVNGAASVYLSSGGGFIGGEKHETIRKAAQTMVASAIACQSHARATDAYPLPGPHEVNFYFLTDGGVLKAASPVKDLSSGQGPFAKLGDAGQGIITQYRLISERGKGKAGTP